MRFFLLTAESGSDEHAGAHIAGIVDLDAHFGGTDIRIENGADVADRAGDDVIGIGFQANFGAVSQANVGQLIFVNVAEDPDVGEI